MADDTERLKEKVITQAFVAGQMDAQLKYADEVTRPSLKLLQAKTYAMAQESMDALIAAVRAEKHTALAESVKLQAHYAELLNMHDGGQRMIFPTVEAWLERLRQTKSS